MRVQKLQRSASSLSGFFHGYSRAYPRTAGSLFPQQSHFLNSGDSGEKFSQLLFIHL